MAIATQDCYVRPARPWQYQMCVEQWAKACRTHLREAGICGVILTQQQRRQWCRVRRIQPQLHCRHGWFSDGCRFLFRRHDGRCIMQVSQPIWQWHDVGSHLLQWPNQPGPWSRQPNCTTLHWLDTAATCCSRHAQFQQHIPEQQC